jgi:hypothetical protein
MNCRGALSGWVRGVGVLLVIALIGGGAGCDRGEGVAPDPSAKPGRLSGKLSDARGKPLRDVTVTVFGFSDKGEPVNKEVTVEGPAGEYEIELPPGKYNTPTARIGVEYNERWYVLPLAAADDSREWPEQRDSRKGLVRDFVWRISGPVPGGDPLRESGHWGGTIHFDKGADLGDLATIEITLTPEGPLIDGSQGKPVTYERKLPWKRHEDHLLFDVPLGRYQATAKVLYGTRPKPLRLASYTIDPSRPEMPSPDRLPTKVPVEFECHQPKPGVWKILNPNLIAFPPG